MDFIIIISIGLLIGDTIFNIVRNVVKETSEGTPPIPLSQLILSKLLAGVCLTLFVLQAFGINISMIPVPFWLELIAVSLTVLGVVFSIISMHQLGEDLISGLPDEKLNMLQTGSVFRFSRNPLYTSFIIVVVASCLYVIHPVTIGCAAIAWYLHHKIIVAEENFLIGIYGAEYEEYTKQVPRYIFFK